MMAGSSRGFADVDRSKLGLRRASRSWSEAAALPISRKRPPSAKYGKTGRGHFARQRVEDDVNASTTRAAHHLAGKVGGAGAHHVPDADRLQIAALLRRSRRREDLGTALAGDLHRGQTDAAGGGMDEHGLAGAQPTQVT
jgi:hypothetical protein